jgi:hypothetical protein
MPNSKFHSESRFRNPGLIALLALMTILVVYHIAVILVHKPSVFDAVVTSIITVLIGLGWWAVAQSRMKIKVSKKYLKLRVKGLIGRKLNLPLRDIVDCKFVNLSSSARWSGSLASPSAEFKSFDFGGRGGVVIEMRDGQTYFIGCDELFARRHDKQLQKLASAS